MKTMNIGYILGFLGLLMICFAIGTTYMLPQSPPIELTETEEIIRFVGVFSLFSGLGFTHSSLFWFGKNGG